jgi:hypothetical protein
MGYAVVCVLYELFGSRGFAGLTQKEKRDAKKFHFGNVEAMTLRMKH